MESITYKIETFEGPLDLLLSLIQKNKMKIEDIAVSVICEQYLDYIKEAESMDMELAGEFLVMASELLLLKSKMLLPRNEEEEEDPRKDLADALLRYQAAKEAAAKMAPLYSLYSGRFAKDTDEISIDRSFVEDQDVVSLCFAIRRIIAANESRPKADREVFAPMIARPIVPVERKITGILRHIHETKKPTMRELLLDADDLPELIATFLGILELVRMRKILIDEDPDSYTVIHGLDTKFILNDDPDGNATKLPPSDEPIPLSSKAEMHKAIRTIVRYRKKAKQSQDEAQIKMLLDDTLAGGEDDLIDDLGLDAKEIVSTLAALSQDLKKTAKKN